MGSAHPDADIYPEATGPAAKVVAAHQGDEGIILYSGWFCPFVQRSWITLEEKKIPYKYVEINPYNKEPRQVAGASAVLHGGADRVQLSQAEPQRASANVGMPAARWDYQSLDRVEHHLRVS